MDQQPTEVQKQSWSLKNIFFTILGIAIIAIAIWYVQQSNQEVEDNGVLPIDGNTYQVEENSAEDIQSDLQGIDTGDIEEEFQSVDKDLDNL